MLYEWAEGHWQSDSHSRLAFLGSTVKCDPSLKLFQQCWSCEGNTGQIANTYANCVHTHTENMEHLIGGWYLRLIPSQRGWLVWHSERTKVKQQHLHFLSHSVVLSTPPLWSFLYCVKCSCLFLSLPLCLSLTPCASHFLCLSLCWTSWLAGFLCVLPRGGQWMSGVFARGRLPECVVGNDTHRQTCHHKMLF